MRLILSFLLLAGAVFAAPPVDFNTLIEQGRAALDTFDLPAARTALERACPAGLDAFPAPQAALCEHYSAALAEAMGRDEEAARRYRDAVARWEASGPAYLAGRISSMTNLGSLLRRQRRFEEAERTLSEALELSKPLAITKPASHATALGRLATVYGDLDQPDRARAMLVDAIATLRTLPSAALELAYAKSSLGMLELHTGHYKAGEASLREAVSLASVTLGEENPETAAWSTDLALALLLEGQFDRAEILLRRARFVIESRLGPESVHLINTLGELSSVERELRHFGLAEECGENALRILHSHLPAGNNDSDSLEIVLLQANLGNLYVREHKIAEAERVLPAAVEAERRLFKDDRALADSLRNLASLRSQQGAWNEAESLYREAIGVYERKLGAEHPDLAPVLREYAVVLKHQGAPRAQVKNIEARARSITAG